ncbi:hypothetical protein M5689_020801 [Euphorbia peplus]|nr:hypothetical protein M5689_020801 [Euphorbia peplus]
MENHSNSSLPIAFEIPETEQKSVSLENISNIVDDLKIKESSLKVEVNLTNLQEAPARFETEQGSTSLPPKSKTPKGQTPKTPKTPLTRKQFRSLKAVRNYLSENNKDSSPPVSIQPNHASNSTTTHLPRKVNESEEASKLQESYPWEEMQKKNKRKRGENHHQSNPNSRSPPTFNFGKIPKLVTFRLEINLDDEDFWLPEFKKSSKNSHKLKNPQKTNKLWTAVFVSLSENRDPSEVFSAEIIAGQANISTE